MENKNLYEILGLSPKASKEEIKIAYRKFVRIYHPDINKTKEAEKFFKLLNNAAQTLLDDAKRLQYDILAGLSAGQKNYVKKEENLKTEKNENLDDASILKSAKTQTNSGFWGNKTNKTKADSKFDEDKTFKNPSSKEFYTDDSVKTRTQGPKIDGKDIETIVTISKTEQKQGTVRKINVLHTDKCPKCAGAKYINGKVCALCHGAGEKSEHKIMNVKIPKGIRHGVKMKIQNEGEYGKFGGKNGDLYLLIQIEENKTKDFEEEKVVLETLITPWQAALGGQVSILYKGKNAIVEIPPLTKQGTSFKLKDIGKNLSSLGLNADSTVIIKIDIKENLSKKEIELYKQLKEIDLGLDSEK